MSHNLKSQWAPALSLSTSLESSKFSLTVIREDVWIFDSKTEHPGAICPTTEHSLEYLNISLYPEDRNLNNICQCQ